MSDADLELIETHLDGQATAAERGAVRRRLADDAGFAGAVASAAAARAVRLAVWQGMEPADPAAGQKLVWRIRGASADREGRKSTARRRFGWDSLRTAGLGSTAAACLMVGFLTGRVGRGTPAGTPAGTAVVSDPGVIGTPVIARANPNPSVVPVGSFQPGRGQFNVPITNDYGQVVSWQPFATAGEAKAFSENLHHARFLPPQMVPAPSATRLVSDEDQY